MNNTVVKEKSEDQPTTDDNIIKKRDDITNNSWFSQLHSTDKFMTEFIVRKTEGGSVEIWVWLKIGELKYGKIYDGNDLNDKFDTMKSSGVNSIIDVSIIDDFGFNLN